MEQRLLAWANAFWPTAVVGHGNLKARFLWVGEADSVNSVTASACHISGAKGVSPGQKALFHGSSECLLSVPLK